MSSTNRNLPGHQRHPADYYETPTYVIKLLLDFMTTPAGYHRTSTGRPPPRRMFNNPEVRLALDLGNPTTSIIEPTAGNGAIIKELLAHPNVKTTDITAVETRSEERSALCRLIPNTRVHIRDVTGMKYQQNYRFDLAVTNPPFKDSMQITRWCLENARVVCILNRLSWVASAKRNAFMAQHRPDMLVLSQRPSFAHGRTDSVDYCWFLFHSGSKGQMYWLPTLTKEERRR
jgi:hypothetical protein